MQRVHYKIVRWPRPNKDGRHTIFLRVSLYRKSRYFSLDRSCFPHEWDEKTGQFLRGYSNYRAENELLLAIRASAGDYIYAIQRERKPFVLHDFYVAVFGGPPSTAAQGLRLKDYFDKLMGLADKGLWGAKKTRAKPLRRATKTSYRTAVMGLLGQSPDLLLSDVTQATASAYVQSLRAKNTKESTISLYVGKLWTVYEQAIADGHVQNNPFGHLTKLGTGDKKGGKRALSVADIRAIEAAALSGSAALYRDIFMLSYYLRGANLADIARLQKKDVVAGRIEFCRQKTEKPYSLQITAKVDAILRRYAELCYGDYIMPVLNEKHLHDDEALENRINQVCKKIGGTVRDLCESLNLSVKGSVVSYMSARHSYATHHRQAGTDMRNIQEALGHSDLRTTETYVKRLENKALDAVDAALWESE